MLCGYCVSPLREVLEAEGIDVATLRYVRPAATLLFGEHVLVAPPQTNALQHPKHSLKTPENALDTHLKRPEPP